MIRGLIFLLLAILVNGCAAIAPISSAIDGLHGGGSAPPVQVHEETRVDLARDDFVVVRTNVWGQSKGFSLLGVITVYPATLVKAMNRMYAAGKMQPGRPQTIAHLLIERSSSYYILFGIPKVEVRADVVEFRPEARPTGEEPRPPPASPTGRRAEEPN